MSIFKVSDESHLKRKMFFDPAGMDVARYDTVKYPVFIKLGERMRSLIWNPKGEVDLSRDKIDFQNLSDHERHIFTSNLRRQILLDSVQGRAPTIALLPHVTLPELEPVIGWWAAFETLHSESYSYIIKNVYSDPGTVFDNLTKDQHILDCASDVTRYYDDFMDIASDMHSTDRAKKEALWLCLMSVNALEGIRFYVSFACSWAFAETKRMEGNAKVIKFIARDENLHLSLTTTMLKTLVKDDPEFASISEDKKDQCELIYTQAIEAEKSWADYLFQDGSMLGLNAALLKQYAEYIGTKRMRSIGLTSPYDVGKANPLPWTEKWISGAAVQVAPQEVEKSEYLIGEVRKTISDAKSAFGGMSL